MTDSVEEYRAKQAAEYGTWVAVEPIFHEGVRAFNPGDAVPAGNVKEHGYAEQKLVRRVSSINKEKD